MMETMDKKNKKQYICAHHLVLTQQYLFFCIPATNISACEGSHILLNFGNQMTFKLSAIVSPTQSLLQFLVDACLTGLLESQLSISLLDSAVDGKRSHRCEQRCCKTAQAVQKNSTPLVNKSTSSIDST